MLGQKNETIDADEVARAAQLRRELVPAAGELLRFLDDRFEGNDGGAVDAAQRPARFVGLLELPHGVTNVVGLALGRRLLVEAGGEISEEFFGLLGRQREQGLAEHLLFVQDARTPPTESFNPGSSMTSRSPGGRSSAADARAALNWSSALETGSWSPVFG